jgi:heptaprenyl diphosphate synthase
VEKNHRIATLAVFIAMAVVVHWFEGVLPRPAPFIRLGFANIFTLCAIYLFGGAWGLVVVAGRVFIGSLIAGGLFTPTFVLSLGGGISAALVMWWLPKSMFSPIGVSVGGAVTHIAAQIFLAAFFIVQHASLLSLMPILLLISIATGILNGYATELILAVFKNRTPITET